ncbi:MAG TPA: DUF4252 domain-containing protein [Gammaproteobacteria bacterium]|nr:DUF4252 domain-containing protein [Gammaproteobacteria bacterium]
MKRHLIGAAALLCTATVHAQGYLDFDNIPGIEAPPSVQIDLNTATLGFIIAAADPVAAEALRGIQNVRLRVYETVADPDDFLAYIDDTSGALERDGWQRVVYVEDEGSKVRVYMQFLEDSSASGITVMVGDGDDSAVLINIAGLIDPQQLGQVMRTVGAGEFMNGIAGDVPGVTGRALESDE